MPTCPIMTTQTSKNFLTIVVKKYFERVAIRMRAGEGNGYDVRTFGDLGDEVSKVSGFLCSLKLKKGDKVGIYGENCPQWCCAYLATVVTGFVIVPIDAMLGEEDAVPIIEDSDLTVLFFSKRHADKISAIRKRCTKVRCFIGWDIPEDAAGKVRSYEGILEHEYSARKDAEDDISPDDAAALIYTSGTTGFAKGVMLSHRNIITNVNASIQSLPIDENDVFMTVLPLHHTYPATCSFISPLVTGGSSTIAESLAGKKIIANITETGGTILIGVPLLYDKMKQGMQIRFRELSLSKRTALKLLTAVSGFLTKYVKVKAGKTLLRSLRKQAGLESLRLLVAGGGPLNPDTAEFFEALGFNIVQGYGTSENSPLIAVNTVRYNNHQSVGLPVKYTEIRIDHPNEEGIGEIIVKSPSVMMGYFKKPEITMETITEDGGQRTGDLGMFDRKGFLYITGRIKNLIVTSGGKNIYPEEIELKFGESEVIGEVLVFGRRESEKNRAEEVFAVCVPHYEILSGLYDKSELTDDFVGELVKREIVKVNRTLPGYKRIRNFTIRKEEFEKTSSRKIKRYLYLGYANADTAATSDTLSKEAGT